MLKRYIPILTGLGIIMLLHTSAFARYPRGEQMQEVKRFAGQLQEDTAYLSNIAREQYRRYGELDQRMLDDLRELADRASHFNDQINREYANPQHTEADYTELKISFAKASRSFPILRADDDIRAALKRTRETMASLTGYYEGTIEKLGETPGRLSFPVPELHGWYSESTAPPPAPVPNWNGDAALGVARELDDATHRLYRNAKDFTRVRGDDEHKRGVERFDNLKDAVSHFRARIELDRTNPGFSRDDYQRVVDAFDRASKRSDRYNSRVSDEFNRVQRFMDTLSRYYR